MSSLKFGTSGLRGLVSDLTDDVCAAYTHAFLAHMQTKGDLASVLLVGHDLRSSSPRIAQACMKAALSLGIEVENCGVLPTPALALRAMSRKAFALMVTGSHIPDDRNGLKFYRPDGEIDKEDEKGILTHFDRGGCAMSPNAIPETSTDAYDAYFARCASILPSGALSGKRIGVYQHSSAARDLMMKLIEALGGKAIGVARSEVFVPVDTEALRLEDVALAKAAAQELMLDALISTDGDADRPLVADERGIFLRGDTVGLLTARFVQADAVATPVTSSTAAELSGFFAHVHRCRVGSPYVIAAMEETKRQGATVIVGYEANGGVLLGSPWGTISALPTRDAMLPILAVLGLAAARGATVSELMAELPGRFTASGRIEHVDASLSGPFLAALANAGHAQHYFAELGKVHEADAIDGQRFMLEGGDVIHYRASGNAPELRCYVEAESQERAQEVLQWGLTKAARAL
ncbi:phosphomannomutase [Limoniibacter endophyticus]|uniref:Phosphomannomutase n=1 Tax=Limoniibacter endophyticus TaxID=1565040 RepID=A0A8J3GI52_9HYPH|nr:phosphomannomutase [Limoniibacter endophyticus]GHC70330.1 phosphomannomutase [Limoniibacter endophyticus]